MRDRAIVADRPDDTDQIDRPHDGAIAVAVKGGATGAVGGKILASGRGALAEAILRIAFDQGVKVREDADLAQLLGVLDVGEDIPVDALVAVAEVLTYVYRANGATPPEEVAP